MKEQIKQLIDFFTPADQQFSKEGFYQILEQSIGDPDWQQGVIIALENLANAVRPDCPGCGAFPEDGKRCDHPEGCGKIEGKIKAD